jgi:uncharacterized protein YlzI (FlbEa/FlbD family)
MWNLCGFLLLVFAIYTLYNNIKKLGEIFNVKNNLLEMKKEINTIKEDLDEIKSFIDGNCIVVNGLIKEMNNKINNLKED